MNETEISERETGFQQITDNSEKFDFSIKNIDFHRKLFKNNIIRLHHEQNFLISSIFRCQQLMIAIYS